MSTSTDEPVAPAVVQEPSAPGRPLPMNWIIWTGIAAGLGLVFTLAQVVRTYGTPGSTVAEAYKALVAADTKRLRQDEHLGLKVLADNEINTRGTAEYNRIIAIFKKAEREGSGRYLRSRKEMWRSGEAAFNALPHETRSGIRSKSKDDWLARQAFASLSAEEQKVFGSADVLGDKKKIKALAYKVAKPNLSEEDKLLIGDKAPDSEAVQQDNKLKAIVAKARRAGMAVLGNAANKANRAARANFYRLSRHEQRRIKAASYNRYVWKTGLSGHADKAFFMSVDVLLQPSNTQISGLLRALGLASLEPKERAEIEKRDHDKFVAAREKFIEKKGTKLYKKFLKETFPAHCCEVSRVRYIGRSGRSLMRNREAMVVLAFGPVPADVVAKAREKDKDAKVEHPAKDYLGAAVTLDFDEGKWKIDGFGKDRSGKVSDGVAASLALLKSPGTIVSLVLLSLLGLAVVLAVALRRSASAIACAEGAAAVMVLAVVQSLVQGQITLDDVFFTPLYMAIPVWLGMNRGAESGFMAGFVTGLGLTAASALVTVAPWAALVSNELVMQEHFLATLFLALTGAAAGRLRWPAQLPVALPALWLLYYVGMDRSLVLSFSFYGHAVFGCAVVGLGMMLHELGLLEVARRVLRGTPGA